MQKRVGLNTVDEAATILQDMIAKGQIKATLLIDSDPVIVKFEQESEIDEENMQLDLNLQQQKVTELVKKIENLDRGIQLEPKYIKKVLVRVSALYYEIINSC